MTRARLLVLAVFAPLFSGCGTFADAIAGPADDHLYYRGVRMDVAGMKNGLPIMVFDIPFSACADTLLVLTIALGQLTDPQGTKFKSAIQVTGEEMVKSMTTQVIVPVTIEAMKSVNVELQQQQPIVVVGEPAK
jgi:uncharacterized protein YceK